MANDKVKKTKVDKPIKELKRDYKVMGKTATKAKVKANATDVGGNFYVYDLHDATGQVIALNRYVYKNSDEQPFEELTEIEELILNPPYVEPEEMI